MQPSRPTRSAPAACVAALAAALVAAPATAAVTTPAALPAPASAHLPVADPVELSADDAALALTPVGTYATGTFDASAAEIVAHHAATQRVFVVNAASALVEVLDAADPTAPVRLFDLQTVGVTAADGSVIGEGAVANSVAVRPDGLGVVAVENPTKTDDGWLVAFDAAADGTALGAVRVGPLPDMVAITEDGTYAVVANEGEPADDFSVDPEGSVAVVDLPATVAAPAQDAVRTATFHEFEEGGSRTLPEGVRVFGPQPHDDLPVSRNLEPEYVVTDGTTAYVSLQEANAIAVVDLVEAEITEILALGLKDHGQLGNGLDPSDRSDTIDIATVPGLRGMYQPDGMALLRTGGEAYLVTANEGDAREWGDYVEGARVSQLGSGGRAPICADSPLAARTDAADLGRLNVTLEGGLRETGDGAPCYEELHAFGGRSFAIWTMSGELVLDSGDQLEQITAEAAPQFFNSNHTASNLKGRSDDKGPEPETVAIGVVGDRTYAFVGLERVGGIVVFDVTVPTEATFVTYVNNRDFSVSVADVAEGGDAEETAAALAAAGDLGIEDIVFVPAADSPTGEPILVTGNEVSGTTTFFAVTDLEGTDPGEPGPGDPPGRPFSDVGPTHPFAVEIGWMAESGLSRGYADGTFQPSRGVSRQAMAAFVQRWAVASGADATAPTPGTQTFSDVAPDHPFWAEIEWLAAHGLAEGYPDGTFRPDRRVSRQAMAAFLHRAADEPAATALASFSDVQADHPFAGAIAWLAEVEVAEGYPDGTFRPSTRISRQAMAAFLYRFDRLT